MPWYGAVYRQYDVLWPCSNTNDVCSFTASTQLNSWMAEGYSHQYLTEQCRYTGRGHNEIKTCTMRSEQIISLWGLRCPVFSDNFVSTYFVVVMHCGSYRIILYCHPPSDQLYSSFPELSALLKGTSSAVITRGDSGSFISPALFFPAGWVCLSEPPTFQLLAAVTFLSSLQAFVTHQILLQAAVPGDIIAFHAAA